MNRLADLIEKKRKAKAQPPPEEQRESKRQETAHAAPPVPQESFAAGRSPISPSKEHQKPSLLPADVKRRLRLLGQPVTLFAETDAAREARLKKAEEEFQVEDEHTGGQVNSTLQLQREKKEQERLNKLKAAQPVGPQPTTPAKAGDATQQPTTGATEPEDPVAAEFVRAAAALKEKLEEHKLCVEDKISKYLKRYCTLWEEDLDRRTAANKDSGPGRQATLQFQSTVAAFKPLYHQLKQHSVAPEMVAGLWILIQDIENRNYLHAYDIYMHLAVGTAPWPIGVTSIGIHDRSAREKIGHTMNAAHIMNDEATRKYLQGVKRMLTFMQRVFPTDPSRSVDFDGFKDGGRGAAGAGSDKLALLQAEQAGVTSESLGLLPAPHHLDTDGSVKVPDKWENMVRRSEAFKEKQLTRTPPRTPPRGS